MTLGRTTGYAASMARCWKAGLSIRRFGIAASLLILFLLQQQFVEAQSASTPAEVPSLSVTSRLVYVDVVVRDSRGQVVRGLTEQDFKLEEDGKPQRLDYFAAHSYDVAAAEKEKMTPSHAARPFEFSNVSNRGTAPGAINMILFDLLNTPSSDQLEARKQLLKFLLALPPGQQVALFVLTDHLTMIQGFTASSDRLTEAAQHLDPRDFGMVRSKTEEMQDNDFITTMAQVIGHDPGGSVEHMKQNENQNVAEASNIRARITLAAFAQLAQATSGYSGRKNLFWLSESFPLAVGEQLTESRLAAYTNLHDSSEIAELIATARIAVYPISLLGLEGAGISAASSGIGEASPIGGPMGSTTHPQMGDTIQDQVVSRFDLKTLLNRIAEITGGEAFVGTNDFARALRRGMNDGSNYYTLAYSPQNQKWNGQYRKIRVELAGKSYSLTYRRGYVAYSDAHPKSADGQELIDALRPYVPESTTLALRAFIQPPNAQSAVTGVDTFLNPGNVGFTTSPDGIRHAQLAVLLVAFDDGEQQKGSPLQTSGALRLDFTPEQYKQAMASGIPFHQELALKPGRYRLRLGVSDVNTHRIGTLDMPVVIGAAATAGR
jgi:VWFA-related protein